MILTMDLGKDSYDIVLERGCLKKAGEYLNLNRKVLIVTDSGVPAEYARTVADCCNNAEVITLPQGEGSKSLASFEMLLLHMLEHGYTRSDCVVGVGGGMVGDLSGFVAACFMRGIDYYNIPTTTLSQVDSSIGGKTAIDMGGYKNMVGAFHQPKKVLVDLDTVQSLPQSIAAGGLVEAMKMGMTSDASLFALFESSNPYDHMDEIVEKGLRVKKYVVEQDEKESGLRKILNFGHTIGHGIEAVTGKYHGACVAIGILPMCSPEIRKRTEVILREMGLETTTQADPAKIYEALLHDKKCSSDGTVTVTTVDTIGTFQMTTLPVEQLKEKIASL